VRSADEYVVGSVGICFALFQVVDIFGCCGLWRLVNIIFDTLQSVGAF